MTNPEYRLSPEGHATVDDTMDQLQEVRNVLGYVDASGLAGEPETVPDRDAVLYAGDVVGRTIEALSLI